ncbi:conserved hypothetical protein [Planctopirus limnophila DSM 3776]|uniref:Uncharacterized protein n=2 Tax=Planctopirus limnophila TaxID=120 RepID=D5SQW6_PLAL2|nr:conserved hypothetical protein [Planctopirus limnophila DSM 3776]
MLCEHIMKTTEVRLEDLSNVRCRYFMAEIPGLEHLPTLIVEFSGECGFGSGSNADACYMNGMIAAGFKAWDPSCFILDLRRLKYEWGDMMTAIFAPPHELISMNDEEVEFPFAAIVSDLNRDGLTSLVKEEMRGNPEALLFETFDDAQERVTAIAKQTYHIA